jgi:hypothetical protein
MVRPTSAADINSLPVAASPAASMRDMVFSQTSFSASLDGSLKDVDCPAA